MEHETRGTPDPATSHTGLRCVRRAPRSSPLLSPDPSTWGRQSTPTQIRHMTPSPSRGEFGKLHPFLPRKMERSSRPGWAFLLSSPCLRGLPLYTAVVLANFGERITTILDDCQTQTRSVRKAHLGAWFYFYDAPRPTRSRPPCPRAGTRLIQRPTTAAHPFATRQGKQHVREPRPANCLPSQRQ